MAGSVDELIDVLYGMVEEAWAVPLGKDKCVVQREKVLDILDELRGNLPGEFRAARDIVEKRNELLAAGKREAEAIRHQAEEKAKSMVEESSIVVAAQQRSNELLLAAEQRSKEIKRAASEYCDEALRRTEETMTAALAEVRKMRQDFRGAVAK